MRNAVPRLNQISNDLITAVEESVEADNELALKTLHAMTSEQYLSTEELRKLGHPYSRRHYVPGFPMSMPSILNRQTGLLDSSWKQLHAEFNAKSGEVESDVHIDPAEVPYSIYMDAEGTDKMVPRPIIETAAEIIDEGRAERAGKVIMSSIEKGATHVSR